MTNKQKFPFRQNIITTVVILLTYAICISVLYAIKRDLPKKDYTGLILIIVFSSIFGLLLVYFWLREIIRFKKVKYENK